MAIFKLHFRPLNVAHQTTEAAFPTHKCRAVQTTENVLQTTEAALQNAKAALQITETALQTKEAVRRALQY